MVKEQVDQTRAFLCKQAAARYKRNIGEINRVKSLIESNREGQTDLLDISQDEKRKKLRVARVESSSPLERINGVPNFQDIAIIKKITQLSECVCRIVTENPYGSTSYGTGFLVSKNLLLTNNHVLADIPSAQRSTAQFKYEVSPGGHKLDPVNFRLRPDIFFLTSNYIKSDTDPFSGLDFTLVAVEELNSNSVGLDKFGYAQLDAGVGKVLEGESCVVIQHPKGDYKKIVLKDIRMISLADDFLIYESDTEPGSSGSLVAGLGTAEIIALHHSAVPRMDDQGNWLRKDGGIATSTDPDSSIDWIGNEGVRISRIVKMIQAMEVSENMRPVHQNFLNGVKGNWEFDNNPTAITTAKISSTMKSIASDQPTHTQKVEDQQSLGDFEIQLVSNPILEKDWEENAASLVPGFVAMEQLFEEHTDRNDPKLFYLTCKTADNPWATAEKIEKLVHIHYCAPDLPLPTDGMRSPETGAETYDRGAIESAVYSRGYAKPNESNFISKWRYSKWISKLLASDKTKSTKEEKLQAIRQWNWHAVNLEKGITSLNHWAKIEPNLQDIRIAQLDTGYSTLSKVAGGFDLQLDYDFIDLDDTAKDEIKKYLMKHPFHGTRTASIIVGGHLKDQSNGMDGNHGLLTTSNTGKHLPVIKVIPYRVANSVILIGRSRHVLAAVEHAVRNQTDVMFMCMGNLPTPGLDMAARVAYEHGIIWVCAAGNEVEFVVAPASFPGTIAVAAINPNDEPWDGSSYGEMVDIAAPGERVYVPFIDKHRNEIMVYGDGTSYATPHVAAAAALWKSLHKIEIKSKYRKPWQVIEAFRTCLSRSSRKDTDYGWEPGNYGDGILDITKLLDEKLPQANELEHAYHGQDRPVLSQSTTTQAFHVLWQGLVRKINPWEPKPYEGYNELTDGGREALNVLRRAVQPDGYSALEGAAAYGDKMAIDIFRQFAEQYSRNIPKY